MTTVRELVRVCSLADLERERLRVTTAAGRAVLLVLDEGRVFALDNRCPHMGFPLRRGTVEGGILTCHWHHAKFDLASGCTFDLFADDAPTFPVEVRDGEVWLDPTPPRGDRREHWLGRLQVGLEQDIPLVLAKGAIALTEQGAATDALTRAAVFGLRNRRAGWSQGMTILTALAAVLPVLDPEDRALALFHGLRHVAASTAGQPPEFDLEPLASADRRPERFLEWFRYFVEVRQADAAERTLVTAIEALPPREVADLVFAACTDHLYLDTGHTLDFANKAFELLDLVGWGQACHVLPALVPALVRSQRMEETSTWRHPADVASLVRDAQAELAALPEREPRPGWDGHADLAEVVLDGEPSRALEQLVRLTGDGVPVTELSAAVAYAGARRAVHFPTSNEFGDWETVLHGFTYANAVDQAMRRAPSRLLSRGVLDAAMAVSLERFLNVPRRAIPAASGSAGRREILAAFDEQGRVDEVGQLVVDALADGDDRAVVRALGHALLREDGQFHHFQMYEAMVRQWTRFRGRSEAVHVLVGAARYLAAHAPTVRATGQTFDIAARLHRGESLHEDA
ncbi:MAG TPA: Rieske (2Fe-2S) protein [Terriglobales bacterium]|nr:Rieske (2Fe-2S) protein [Terriglobales bacterium]